MKRTVAVLISLLLIIGMLPAASFADEGLKTPTYIESVYNEENGLPTGEANAIVQDASGYLWIGSYGGLIRYDGSKFEDFSDEIYNASVRSLYVASNGDMYIGTNDSGAFVMRDGGIFHIEVESDYSFLCIRDFTEDFSGTIFAASTTGVARIVDGVLKSYNIDKTDGEQFYSIACDTYGNVWALSDLGNIFIFNEQVLIDKISSSKIFDRGLVYSINSDESGNLWFGSSLNEVYYIRFDTSYYPNDLNAHERFLISTGEVTNINHIQPLPDNTAIISALNGFGYVNIDREFVRVDSPKNTNAISANWGARDSQGNLWLASSNYGIIRYAEGCIYSCNENSGIGELTINAVAKADGLFYLGTDSGLILCDENWKEHENALTDKLAGVRIRNICVDTKGQVWFATYSVDGAICYEPETGKITGFGEERGLNSNKVRVVYPLSDGRMLVGNQGGINIIENGEISESYGISDGMETTSVLCAMELDGRIYVGTDGSGIYEITENGLVSHYLDEGLLLGVILRMMPDSDNNGSYYVCSGSTLYYYDAALSEFRELTQIEFGSGSVYNVYDKNGYIWLLQNAGIFAAGKSDVLSGSETYTFVFGKDCGLTGTLSANTWCWLDDDGSLYLPTRNGVSCFAFSGVRQTMPKPAVNSVTVDNHSYYANPSEIRLSDDAQRISIELSAMNFSDTVGYILAYRLVGFDDEEILTEEKNISISYTNLKGGSYSFEYRLITPMSGESTEVYSLPIEKAIHYTERPAFWAAVALLGVLLMVFIFWLILRRRNARAEARQKELKAIIDQALLTITATIDAKDEYTNGHSVRVATYSKELARRLGLSEDDQERIFDVGLLHDIGKIGVPDSVLNKKGKLTDEEFDIIRSHPKIGGKILSQFTAIPGIADGAKYHHERWDGRGYCEGLKGEEIPYFARIIAVADSYDAMQSNRVYRKGVSDDYILSELKNGSGTQFDPAIVPHMIAMIEDGFAPIDYEG